MINVLSILPRFVAEHPLLGEQTRLDPRLFRAAVCYLSGGRAPSLEGREGSRPGRPDSPAREGREFFLGYPPRRARRPRPSLVLDLKRIIEKEGIHIVNSHLYKPTLPAVLAARLARNRPAVISTIHGLGSSRTPARRLVNRILYKGVARIVAVCEAVRRDILENNPRLPGDKVVVVPNGIDYAPFPAAASREEARADIPLADREGFRFGAVSRLTKGKNVERLVEAFARIAPGRPGCSLAVAGDGPEGERLRRRVEALGLEGRVALLGFRRDVPLLLRSLDAFVHVSLREGIPLALLEAMASGLPIVASRRGGIVEVFGEERIGILVDPESPASIARAMESLLEAPPEERAAMGRRARARALGAFSAEKMVAALEKLYRDVAAERAEKGFPSITGRGKNA